MKYLVKRNEYNEFSKKCKETVYFETEDLAEANKVLDEYKKTYKVDGITDDFYIVKQQNDVKIYKHKAIDMGADEIYQAYESKKIPSGIAIDVSRDEDGLVITAAPLDTFVLFPKEDENFELSFYGNSN